MADIETKSCSMQRQGSIEIAIKPDAPGNLALTVFRLHDLGKWQDRIVAAVESAGLRIVRKGPKLQLWDPGNVVRVSRSTLRYVEGVKLVRQWLGPKKGAIAIIPKRMYFEEGAEEPSRKPEWELLGDRRIALPSPSERIKACLAWASKLSGLVEGFDAEPMKVARARSGLQAATRLEVGGGAIAQAGAKVSQHLMRHGFYNAPDQIRIDIVAPKNAGIPAKRYQQLLADALKRCHAHGTISLSSYEGFIKRYNDGKVAPEAGQVTLLAVTGKKGLPLEEDAANIIRMLSDAHRPFRMFSVDNTQLNWSALDQIGSLLSGAGGIAFITHLPWPEQVEAPFILGVDVGHPMDLDESRVVISMLDHRGTHIRSWRFIQKRDETIGAAPLSKGLRLARQMAKEISGKKHPVFLVLRDGRLHQGERFETYQQILGRNITFVEFSKYDNPEMFTPGIRPTPAPAGSECLLEGSSTPFITPVSPRLANDLSRSFKLNMPAQWDGLNLGMDRVAEIITGLSYTPGQGLATHALPAPIYWADGVAAIANNNHQFSGIKFAGGHRA